MITATVTAHTEGQPGPVWTALAAQSWPAYQAWYLRDGAVERPSYLACERALRTHMPELVPLFGRLVALAGGSDVFARFLSGWCPPAYATGCTQGVWLHGEPLLVRTYDYTPLLWEGRILRTGWADRTVVGNADCLWGLLDGINDQGLCVSLAFGGRRVLGEGFGVPVILRYVLQVCDTAAQAIAALQRIPCHMAYNVTLLDAEGQHATVFLSPDRAARVTAACAAANHQGRVEWPEHALSTRSEERLAVVEAMTRPPGPTARGFVRRFLSPPLWSNRHEAASGTLYAACYAPRRRSLSMLWPDSRWDLGIDDFLPGSRQVRLTR